jgi:hypothetical protein
MKETIYEVVAWGIFYSFFVILLVWGILMLRARDRWAEEDRLKAEQEAANN